MDSFVLAQDIGQTFAETVSAGPILLALLAAAAAGLVSFASPCVIPLVPGYVSYLAGVVGADTDYTAEGTKVKDKRAQVASAALLFVLGFTVVFVLATVTVFGVISTLMINQEMLMRAGGVVTIAMGVIFMGFIRPLQRDTRMAPKRWTTLAGAPLLGGVFALGWTPCLGPTLASIISVSAGTEGATAARGVALIIAYCLGLGIPLRPRSVRLLPGTARRGLAAPPLADYPNDRRSAAHHRGNFASHRTVGDDRGMDSRRFHF